MPRSLLVRAVFGVLVLATFAAFIVAQRLKRSRPVVEHVYYNRYLSPASVTGKKRVRIFFSLPKAGRVTATIVDTAGDAVRTLVDDRRLSKGRHRYAWNGRESSGALAPDGVYHLRVTLRDEGRSVTLPRKLILDTVPPHPRILSVAPPAILPGAADPLGRARIAFRGRDNPPPLVSVYRTDVRRPQLVARFHAHRGRHTVFWGGLVNGSPAPDGVYAVGITTYDRAGNAGAFPRRLPPTRAEATQHTGVSVRYLTVSGPSRPVAAGSVAHFQVGPLPRRLRWSLGPVRAGASLARGLDRGGRIAVRVPSKAPTGLYLLRVRAAGHHAAWPVAVQGRRRGSVLVVLPWIAWQGANPVDDDGDGFPNLLAAGSSVAIDRPFAHGRPPAGAGRSVVPLLRLLARDGDRYEITTDVALAERGRAGLAGRSGVLFAGDETWLTSRLDLALRSYVERGGRVASFGSDSFRRRVTLDGGRLTAPTAPERVNVFGEETSQVHIEPAPMVVGQQDSLGLFRGVTGGLFGSFDGLEQSQRLVGGTQVLASAGRDPQHPAFVAYRLGKGIVVRVGSSEWASELATSTELTDITRRIWSLLSR